MGPEEARWIRWLFRIAGRRASGAELGDLIEEYAAGQRSPLWLCRQVLSTTRRYCPMGGEHPKGNSAMLSNVWRDVRYALRTFRRSPAFAVAAVAPIALGIGINTGIFSILNSVALRPLSTPASGELVTVYQRFQGVRERRIHGSRSLFSLPEYRAYRDEARTLSGLMAYSRPWTVTMGTVAPEEIDGVLVTCNYFDVLRLRPRPGRASRQLRQSRGAADRDPEPRPLDARVPRTPDRRQDDHPERRSVGVAGRGAAGLCRHRHHEGGILRADDLGAVLAP